MAGTASEGTNMVGKKNLGILCINNLRASTIIGVNEWERKQKQEVLVSVELQYDVSKAAKTDNIKDAVDYGELARKIIVLGERSSYFLIEKLANAILELVLSEKKVVAAKVRVEKPAAVPAASGVSVEVGSLR